MLRCDDDAVSFLLRHILMLYRETQTSAQPKCSQSVVGGVSSELCVRQDSVHVGVGVRWQQQLSVLSN